MDKLDNVEELEFFFEILRESEVNVSLWCRVFIDDFCCSVWMEDGFFGLRKLGLLGWLCLWLDFDVYIWLLFWLMEVLRGDEDDCEMKLFEIKEVLEVLGSGGSGREGIGESGLWVIEEFCIWYCGV